MLQHNEFKQNLLSIKLNAIKYIIIAIFIFSTSLVQAENEKTILAFGDSLTAGYGLAPEEGFTVILENKLNNKGLPATVINAGVSGDTTSGGFARLEWVLASYNNIDLVILTLGGNDALRGINPDLTRRNMDKMLAILTKRKIPTLIAGMMAPPNLGQRYGNNFNSIYPDMAKKYHVALYPFFLEGVAGDIDLNQRDRIHPNPNGVNIITDKLSPIVIELLKPGLD